MVEGSPVGNYLNSRYFISQQLGEGGFSATYLAHDQLLQGNPCVVKKLQLSNQSSISIDVARRLFQSEAEALYGLGPSANGSSVYSRQIPMLLAHFEQGGEFYLVEEFIEGENLGDRLAQGEVFSQAEVVWILNEILPVLKFIHSKGVIHRDLKPRNLIQRQTDGKIVLIDFGAVKYVDQSLGNDQTGATIAIGTLGYMPDEQRAGKPRFSSDIYALGMVGIHALTGVHPSQLDLDLRTGEVIWKEHLPDGVHPRLVSILNRMVAPHLQHRYSSAAEVLQELSPLCGMLNVHPHIEDRPPAMGSQKGWSVWNLTTVFLVLIGLILSPFLLSINAFRFPDLNLSSTSSDSLESGKQIAFSHDLEFQNPVVEVLLLPGESSFLAASDDFVVGLYDLRTGDLLRSFRGHSAPVSVMAIDRAANLLATGSQDGSIKVWDLRTGSLLRTLTQHSSEITVVAISPSSQTIATGSLDKTIILWDLKTGNVLQKIMQGDAIRSLVYSPTQLTLISTGDDHHIRVWDLKTSRLQRILSGHVDEVHNLWVSPNGSTLFSVGTDRILKWDLQSESLVLAYPLTQEEVMGIHANSSFLSVLYHNGEIRLWDQSNPSVLLDDSIDKGVNNSADISFQHLISADGKTVRIWRIFTPEERASN